MKGDTSMAEECADRRVTAAFMGSNVALVSLGFSGWVRELVN